MSDSESRGPGFVLCPRARHIKLPTILVKPRKCWLHPDMTEKLLTRMLSLNANTVNWADPGFLKGSDSASGTGSLDTRSLCLAMPDPKPRLLGMARGQAHNYFLCVSCL